MQDHLVTSDGRTDPEFCSYPRLEVLEFRPNRSSDCTEKESSSDALSPPSSCRSCSCCTCCWFVAGERPERRSAGNRAHRDYRSGVDCGSEHGHSATGEPGDDLSSERLRYNLGADRQEGSELPPQRGREPCGAAPGSRTQAGHHRHDPEQWERFLLWRCPSVRGGR